MNTITCATDTNASVRSAMTAARVRVAWPQTEINLTPAFAPAGQECVQMMSLGHDNSLHGSVFLGHVAQGHVAQDRGLAITTFPTLSGPPL